MSVTHLSRSFATKASRSQSWHAARLTSAFVRCLTPVRSLEGMKIFRNGQSAHTPLGKKTVSFCYSGGGIFHLQLRPRLFRGMGKRRRAIKSWCRRGWVERGENWILIAPLTHIGMMCSSLLLRTRKTKLSVRPLIVIVFPLQFTWVKIIFSFAANLV